MVTELILGGAQMQIWQIGIIVVLVIVIVVLVLMRAKHK